MAYSQIYLDFLLRVEGQLLVPEHIIFCQSEYCLAFSWLLDPNKNTGPNGDSLRNSQHSIDCQEEWRILVHEHKYNSTHPQDNRNYSGNGFLMEFAFMNHNVVSLRVSHGAVDFLCLFLEFNNDLAC